ncbi:chemotaxis protein CheW [Desulfobacula toluolica]|uniref:CheW2: chemotaxis protein CheW n=1 Tax=Desulfobacula toluolica (strain DSM 7467 / Tol2) TaxID=651182 RepID=K0N839_DESTT|nr:chemotaxis protein CheW [Desulfobacula toluolica]CCK80064.1 CheW2: chemotaxis protein CheW [Desulfobacula toluolica Tol2]
MSSLVRLLGFSLSGQRYALHLDAVDRVISSVEITRLPNAPDIVLGVVNVQGRVLPVFNIRKRFGIPDKEIDLTDHLIIAHTIRRTVILLTDSVNGVIECSEQEVTKTEKIIPGMGYIEGIVKFENGMIFIHDLNQFLSLDEEKALDDALYQ